MNYKENTDIKQCSIGNLTKMRRYFWALFSKKRITFEAETATIVCPHSTYSVVAAGELVGG
jgi:hypothetical protein